MRRTMRSPLGWVTLLCLPLAASCFQKGPGPEGQLPPQVDAGNLNVQCPSNSAACFNLCLSPECALADGGRPPVLETPIIWYQPGGAVNNVGAAAAAKTTTDPCVAINDASQVIRRRSCGACHIQGAQAAMTSHFDYVLDDMKLATSKNNAQTKNMVVPGDPASSYVYQRMVTGLHGTGSQGMPPDLSLLPSYVGASAYQANPNIVVYPTAADVTVIHEWILTCMPGANANAHQNNYRSGLHGPAAGPRVDAGAGARD